MIEFRGLHKSFDGHEVLRGVDLVVPEGQTLALLGGSGTGKSVLIKHAIGLLAPDAGDVIVDGVSIVDADEATLRSVRRRVGYVFQNSALFDSLNVGENLRLAMDDALAADRQAWKRAAQDLLQRVNLDAGVADKFPGELSGGMRKRVGVARAIASNPQYVLYDEPTTGLDPVNADTIDGLILQLARELGVTSIVVTHDLDSAFLVADRIAMLYEGRIHISASPAELLESSDPIVQRFVQRARARPAVA